MRSLFVAALLLLACAHSAAAYDAFSDARSPARFVLPADGGLRLVFKGNLALAWHDLEGEGGASQDSITDTASLGTRSGHVSVDAARLALRLESEAGLAVYTALRFDPERATLESAWFDWRHSLTPSLSLHLEAGLHTPFVAVDDLTYRAPLGQRIYWGSDEAHFTAELSGRRGAVHWWSGLSVAMTRPLETRPVNDAATREGTLAVLSYGTAAPFAGNQPVAGSKLGVGGSGLSLEGFAFLGRLAAARGTDELRNRIVNFSKLPGFNAEEPREQDPVLWWTGGRLDGGWAGFELRLEAVESKESLLRRSLQTAQLGYVWTLSESAEAVWRTLEVRLRGERYRILDAERALDDASALRSSDPSQALTWDWDILTLALGAELIDALLRVTLEYSLLAERNGSAPLGRADVPFANDEWTFGLELRF